MTRQGSIFSAERNDSGLKSPFSTEFMAEYSPLDKDQWRSQLTGEQKKYIENKCGMLIEDDPEETTEGYEGATTTGEVDSSRL